MVIHQPRLLPGRGGPIARARPAASLAILALAAAGVGGASLTADPDGGPAAPVPDAPSAAEAAPALPDDVAAQAPAETGVASIEVSDAGRVLKELGEPAGIVLTGAQDVAFQITVHDISVLAGCPGRGVTLAPERGYFVVIDLAATVDADVAALTGPDLFMPLDAGSFGVLGPDGTPQASPTEASWGCYEDDELAAPFVGAAETTTGKVVLDSAASAGTLVYTPGGNTGWEWGFE